MALSCLLRGALHGCKVRPLLGVVHKISPISSVASRNFIFQKNSEEIKNTSIVLNGIRQFATTKTQWSGNTDHSKIWTLERGFSAGLLGIVPLGIMFPNVLFDILMAVGMVMHSHWGIEAIVVDYVRPSIFGPAISKIAHVMVFVLSIGILVGLLNLTFNNAGIGNSIKLFWRI